MIAGAVVAQVSACSHAWDSLEPSGSSSSLGSGGGGAAGSSSSSGTGGASSSSSSSSGTGGGASSSSSSGAGGSASSSTSSSGSGGGAPTHCGGTDVLSWDFAVDQPDIFYRDSETDVTGGEGVITLPPTTGNGGAWADFSTSRRYDLRGDRVYVEVTQVPNQPAGAWGGLLIDYDNGDDLFLDVYKGELECGFDRGGNESLPAKITYDPIAHRYWQIREDQGTIHCETSPDGSSWSEFGAYDLGPSLLGAPAAIRVQLYAATPDQVAMPGAIHFDNLNGGGPATGGWCPAQSYTDPFADAAKLPGPAWLRSYDYGGASYDQGGDQLNFRATDAQSGTGYQSSVSYDLTGQRLAIQVVALPTDPHLGLYFGEGNNDSFEVYWDINPDGASCQYDDAGNNHTIWQGLPLTLPAWISLRESGGKTYCEVLEDGAWKPYGAVSGVVDPTHVDVFMGLYANQGLPSGNYVGSFDDYNLPPVP